MTHVRPDFRGSVHDFICPDWPLHGGGKRRTDCRISGNNFFTAHLAPETSPAFISTAVNPASRSGSANPRSVRHV
jgi:hypothetical protein